jgi:hypothetical protein
MENFAKDFISLLQYLLPGFVTAWIFYGFTSYPKPSQFERVVQALIFTLIIQSFVGIVERVAKWAGQYWSAGSWDTTTEVIWSPVMAVAVGVVFSWLANNDKAHKWFRGKGITRETSFPSEWFGTFLKEVTFVVLHFKDERRLYGWPIEWPSEPSKGHFLIADPSWVGESGEEIRIARVKNILVDVNDVKWVEFLENTWEEENVEERIKSAATETAG